MSKPLITNLIRQYSDGELNNEQTAQVEQHLQDHPEDLLIVESERRLRAQIKAVMIAECPKAPEGLADQIRSELAKQEIISENEAQTYAYSPKAWSFGPNKANIFAVAASIALVVGTVLFGIFGNPIDRPNTGVSQAAEAAESVGLEHIKAANDNNWLDLVTRDFTSAETAQDACSKQFQTNIPKFDLTEIGYEFKGGTMCSVPHCDKACHLFYKQKNGKGLVSIHIVDDVGKLNLRDGEPFENQMPLKTSRFFLDDGTISDKPCVVAFSDGKIMYLVMACVLEDSEQVIGSIQASIINQGR